MLTRAAVFCYLIEELVPRWWRGGGGGGGGAYC